MTKCDKFVQTHLGRSQFLERSLKRQSEEPLRSAASENYEICDRRANDGAFCKDSR